MSHVKWAKIANFHTVRASVTKYHELLGENCSVKYRAKVKLHGTNAAVRISSDGQVTAQSRENDVTIFHDNYGFARWVKEREEQFRALKIDTFDVIIYGEWCGPGVQGGVALSKIPEKVFAIFAVRVINENQPDHLTVEPSTIEYIIKDSISGVHIIPWATQAGEFTIDWSQSAEELEPTIERINKLVEEIETQDPWVKAVFDVSGTGEGAVFYPQDTKVGYTNFNNLAFKAKGEKHAVVAKTKPAQANPTSVEGASALAELIVTEARMEQGIRAMNSGELAFDIKKLGVFIKWLIDDVEKECSGEIIASGLDAKVARSACVDRARSWFFAEMKK